MVQTGHFKTLDEFNRGYAGPETLLLEKKCRELAGRQDDFCLICGEDDVELFPQLGPKEIHLCPRQFCRKCYRVEGGWKKNSDRLNHDVYQESEFVPLCCTLCRKRGWNISNPLLGQDQPEWLTWTGVPRDDVLNRRYKHWEKCAVGEEYQAQFNWSKSVRHCSDDMTLESDRKLLKAIKTDLLRDPSRFKRFEKNAISGASPPSGPTFEVQRAFNDTIQRLLKLVPQPVMDDGLEEQRLAEEEELTVPEGIEALEEPGNEDGHGAAEQVQPDPLPSIVSRPQRQAAQFSFVRVHGVPVRQSRLTPQNNMTNHSPEYVQDLLDQQISGSMGTGLSTPDTRRSLRCRSPTQQTPRPRGRPRKALPGPAPLLPSPSTQADDVTPGPSFTHDEMAVDEDSDSDESYGKIKAIMDHKHQQSKKLKEVRLYQTTLLRMVNGQLEQSRAQAKKLEEEREALSTTERELRQQLSATRAANAAFQRTIAESTEERERQLQTNTELKRKIAQQAEQAVTVQSLQGEIEEHKRKHTSLEADLAMCRTREAELETKLAGQREAGEELQKTIEIAEAKIQTLKKENRNFIQSLDRREQELEELRNLNSTVDRKTRAIRGLREDQDEVMEANKQLRKDVANLGAELAIDRGLTEVDGARMQQILARGSLTSELVDRLTQNPFLEVQMSEKMMERTVLARASGGSQPQPQPQASHTSGAKRRRTGSGSQAL